MKRLFLSILPLLVGCALSAQTYHDGVWYSIYDDASHTMNTQGDYETGGVFAPTAGTLNVKWRYEWVDWLGAFAKIDTEVLTSANNGSNTTKVGKLAENTGKNSNTTESFSVGRDINWIKFNRTGVPTHKVIVNHIDIPLAQHILLASGEYGTGSKSYQFETIDAHSVSEPYMVYLRSFLSAGDITVTSSDPNFRVGSSESAEPLVYAVGANACASSNGTASAAANGTLGKIDNYAFPVYFTPQKGGEKSAVITITDGVSTATVSLSGTANFVPEDSYYTYSADICQGEVYSDDRFANLVEEGVYHDTIPNQSGADSIITFTLRLHPLFAQEDALSHYVGAEGEWQGVDLSLLPIGDTTLVAAYNSVYGCDSTYTLHLSVLPRPTTYGDYEAAFCEGDSIEFAGVWYYEATEDDVLLTEKNSMGGDSIVHLSISTNPVYRFEEEKELHVGMRDTWEGVELENLVEGDSTITVAYSSIHGCDSVYVLHLHVEPMIITYGRDTLVVCAGESVEYNGKEYKRSTKEDVTLAGANIYGGDSIVSLVVEALPAMRVKSSLTITEGDEGFWQDIDLSLIPAGDTTLTVVYTSLNGCDSTFILHLEVLTATPTGIHDVQEKARAAEKFFLNGQLYIRKDERLYTPQGALIETKKED